MKLLRLTLLRSKTVIQADIIPPFNFVLRCHTRSSKGKGLHLIRYNSLSGTYIPACWLAGPNVHRLLDPGQLITHVLPKSLSVTLLWAKIPQRDPIPIVNPLLRTDLIFGGRWGAHFYSDSPKITEKQIIFVIGLLSLC